MVSDLRGATTEEKIGGAGDADTGRGTGTGRHGPSFIKSCIGMTLWTKDSGFAGRRKQEYTQDQIDVLNLEKPRNNTSIRTVLRIRSSFEPDPHPTSENRPDRIRFRI
jgi:hypothetical protein